MRTLRIPAFIALFLIIDALVGALLRPYYRAVTLPVFVNFHARYVAENTNAEIVFFGDSRFQHGIDSGIISDACACEARNIAVSGSNMVTTYYQLRDFLATHHPDLLVLGIHWSRLAPQPNGSHYPFLLEMQEMRDAVEYAHISRDLEFVARMTLRTYRYQQALPRFLAGSLPVPEERKGDDEFMPVTGVLSLENFEFAVANHFNVFDQPVDQTQREYFERTLKLLQQHNVAFVVVQAPEFIEIRSHIKHFDDLNNGIASIVTANGGAYIDMNTPNASLTHNENFYADVLHLNTDGAQRFSKALWKEIEPMVSGQ